MWDGGHVDGVHQSEMVDTKNEVAENGVKATEPARRMYSQAFKRNLVRLTFEPRASVARIAREHGINANLLFKWRGEVLRDPAQSAGKAVVPPLLPVTVDADAQAIVAGLPKAMASPVGRERSVIEIEMAGARIVLRGGVDARALRVVVDVLGQRS
jgi:transposase